MTTHDDDFARKVTGYLDHGTASMRAGTAYRLQLARQQALARLDPERAQASELSGALAGAGTLSSGGSGRSIWASGKLWLGVGLVAAAMFGYQGYETWQSHQANELADTDLEILTSDLPIDAYVDRGFQNWLKTQAEDR